MNTSFWPTWHQNSDWQKFSTKMLLTNFQVSLKFPSSYMVFNVGRDIVYFFLCNNAVKVVSERKNFYMVHFMKCRSATLTIWWSFASNFVCKGKMQQWSFTTPVLEVATPRISCQFQRLLQGCVFEKIPHECIMVKLKSVWYALKGVVTFKPGIV